MTKRAALLIAATGLVLTVLIAAGVVYNQHSLSDAGHSPDGGNIIISAEIPETVRIEGEVTSARQISELSFQRDGVEAELRSDNAGSGFLSLRLIDEQGSKFYDLAIAEKLSLSGLMPNTTVTLSAPDKNIYTNVPMDWNGRIVLDIPAVRPLWLSFSQGNQSYRIGIMTATGGAA